MVTSWEFCTDCGVLPNAVKISRFDVPLHLTGTRCLNNVRSFKVGLPITNEYIISSNIEQKRLLCNLSGLPNEEL